MYRRSCPTEHYLRTLSQALLVKRLPQLAQLHQTIRTRTPAVAVSNHTLLAEEQDNGRHVAQPLQLLAPKGAHLPRSA